MNNVLLYLTKHFRSRGPKDVGDLPGFVTHCPRRLAACRLLSIALRSGLKMPVLSVWVSDSFGQTAGRTNRNTLHQRPWAVFWKMCKNMQEFICNFLTDMLYCFSQTQTVEIYNHAGGFGTPEDRKGVFNECLTSTFICSPKATAKCGSCWAARART